MIETLIISLALLLSDVQATAIPDPQAQMIPMHATAYVLEGTTASGEQTRDGICASGHREWLGKTIMMYQRTADGVGELIGIYDCQDTGCHENVIDVWCDGMDEMQSFMDRVYEDDCAGKIYVQIIDR